MAQQDKTLIFSDGQTITADAFSTNVIDLEEGSVADQQVGPAWLIARVVGASSVGGCTEGLSIRMVDRDDTSFANDGTIDADERIIAAIEQIPVAELVDGAVFCVGFLWDDLRRYVKGQYFTNGDAVTGTLPFDLYINDQPPTKLKTQKFPS